MQVENGQVRGSVASMSEAQHSSLGHPLVTDRMIAAGNAVVTTWLRERDPEVATASALALGVYSAMRHEEDPAVRSPDPSEIAALRTSALLAGQSDVMSWENGDDPALGTDRDLVIRLYLKMRSIGLGEHRAWP